jgi:hypothetical protein
MAIFSAMIERAARLVCGAALVAVASGCTMCPDPLDYSGPVPGGSAPQNDFRARSNGILPLGAAPKPWPPLVKASGETADEPTAPADESSAEPEVVAAEVADGDAPGVVVATGTDPAPADEPSEPEPEGVEPASVEEPFPDILPPPRPLRPERRPLMRESLGWKQRG